MNSRLFARAVAALVNLETAMTNFNHFAAEALVSGEQPTVDQAKELAELERRLNIAMDSTPEKSSGFRDAIAAQKHPQIPGLNGVPNIEELCEMAGLGRPSRGGIRSVPGVEELEKDIQDLVDRAERGDTTDTHKSNGHHNGDGHKGCPDKDASPDHEIVGYKRIDAETASRLGMPLPPGVAGVVLARVKSRRSATPLTGEQIGELLQEKISSQR